MHRLCVGAVVVLSMVQAGELESRLVSLRERLGNRSFARRNVTAAQRRAELLGDTLADTAAALERLERAPAGPHTARVLGYLRERLRTAAAAQDAGFAAIEAKLAGLGLPEKLAAWHEFVSHVRARAAEVDAELADLAATAGALPPKELTTRLGALRTRLSTAGRDSPENTVAGPGTTAQTRVEPPAAIPPPMAADPAPGPADLAETPIVQLTPEIRALAAALGNAAAMNAWVATHIEYEPYPGQMLNSQAVLLSGRANDFDQATLLIALLRAANIPARYVLGDVALTREQVRDWLGVPNAEAALRLLGRFLPYGQQGEWIGISHAWVQVWLGQQWMALDPSLKRRRYQPGIPPPRASYDRMAYIQSRRPALPTEPYVDALRAELSRLSPGRGLDEVAYRGAPLPPPPPAPGSPYLLEGILYKGPGPPALYHNWIGLTLAEFPSGALHLLHRMSLPETVLQSLTLSFRAATAADQAVVAAFGGIENTPAAVVNVVPEIRLDGAVVATGKKGLPPGTQMLLTVTHTSPTPLVGNTFFSPNLVKAGETAAVVLGANQVGEALVAARVSRFLERLPAMSQDEATRGLLDVAASRYLHRVQRDKQRLSDLLHMRFYQSYGVENSIAFARSETRNLFDRPFVVTPGRLKIYAHTTSMPLDVDSEAAPNQDWMRIAFQLHNDTTSALEHEIWEELVMIEAVSTMKALQNAAAAGISIRTITRANLEAELSVLQAPDSVKSDIRSVVGGGDATVVIHQRAAAIGTWRGFGYIVEYPAAPFPAVWSFRYTIVDLTETTSPAPGGDTGGNEPEDQPPDPGGDTTCDDPVNVSSGNLFDQVLDLVLRGKGPSLAFLRTYNSLGAADGPLGPGWRHNYQVSLKDNGSTVALTNESGGVLNFRLAGGAYLPPPGQRLALSKDAQGFVLRRKNGNQLRFGPAGQLLSITDRNGNALQLSYTGERLSQVADASGRTLTLSYDAGGRITAVRDFADRRIGYEYDPAGRLTAVTDAAGARTAYSYYTDPIYSHLLKTVTTPEGRVTRYQYYGNRKAARVTDPSGRSASFLYLPLRNETHVVDAGGNLTTYQYDALGNVVRITRSDGSIIDSVHSTEGRLEARTDAAGYTTRFNYDASGNLTSVTDPLGRSMQLTYEPVFHHVQSVQDAAGNVTRYEYDARGNLTRLRRPQRVETRFTWDAGGSLTSVTDAEGGTTTLARDRFGNPTEIRDPLGNVTRFDYDALGRSIRAVDPLGGEVRRGFDALDRVVEFVNAMGQSSTAAYDRDGRLVRGVDFAGRTTHFRYDEVNRLAQVTDALGQATAYGYTSPECACGAAANPAEFRDAAGFSRSQTYDAEGRLVSSADALGKTTRYEYNSRGDLIRKTAAGGGFTTYEYDAARQLVRKAFPDGTEVRFAYDRSGNLVSASNQHVTLTHTYDELKRLASVTDSRFQQTVRYTYNRLGNRTAVTDPEGGVTGYTWDANRRLTAMAAPAGVAVRFSRDALGRITGIDYAGAAAASFRYDGSGRVLELAYTRAGGAAPWASFQYRYDTFGNAVAITAADGAHSYEYDALNRLVRARHDAAPAETYTYDAAGNRTGSATDPAYRYDAAGRLAAAEGARFTYDPNGNLVSKTGANGTTNYTWDAENRLVRVDLAQGGTVTYKYDPFGRRIEKNLNGTVTAWLYDGNDILLEMDAGGRMLARYTHGPALDWPLAVERGGQTFFYHPDALGSVMALTDSSGSPVRSYAYDSWGRRRDPDESGPSNPFQFAGRESDAETGLVYMRARYYDPAVGRFISADPLDFGALLMTSQDEAAVLALLPAAPMAAAGSIGAGMLRLPSQLNPYSYALNAPTRFRDPSGMKCGVMVHIGWSLKDDNIQVGDTTIEGVIDDFDGWLSRNGYTLEYSSGPFVEIRDFGGTGEIIGLIDVRDLPDKFTYVEEPPAFGSAEMWEEFRKMAAEAPELLQQWFRESSGKPWDSMTWSEWWRNVLGEE